MFDLRCWITTANLSRSKKFGKERLLNKEKNICFEIRYNEIFFKQAFLEED